MVMGELDIGPRQSNIPPKGKIVGVMVQYVELSLKISNNLPCSLLEKVLTETREINLGFRQALLPSIIQVLLVDHQVFIVMVITGVDIGLRPSNFLHKPWWTKHSPPNVYSRSYSMGCSRREST